MARQPPSGAGRQENVQWGQPASNQQGFQLPYVTGKQHSLIRAVYIPYFYALALSTPTRLTPGFTIHSAAETSISLK